MLGLKRGTVELRPHEKYREEEFYRPRTGQARAASFRHGQYGNGYPHPSYPRGGRGKRSVDELYQFNAYPDEAARYDELKRQLCTEYADNRAMYTPGKQTLINELLEKARVWRAGEAE